MVFPSPRWLLFVSLAAISVTQSCLIPSGYKECPITANQVLEQSGCSNGTSLCPEKGHSCMAIFQNEEWQLGSCIRNTDNFMLMMSNDSTSAQIYTSAFRYFKNPCLDVRHRHTYTVQEGSNEAVKVCCRKNCAESPKRWGKPFSSNLPCVIGFIGAFAVYAYTLCNIHWRYQHCRAKKIVMRVKNKSR